MYRLSIIINEIFNKYLPAATNAGIQLNLDFKDTSLKVKDPEKVKKDLDLHLDSALKRALKGEVSVNVFKDRIEIRDSGTILSSPAKHLLTQSEHIKVSSRVGFGTKVTIFF